MLKDYIVKLEFKDGSNWNRAFYAANKASAERQMLIYMLFKEHMNPTKEKDIKFIRAKISK